MLIIDGFTRGAQADCKLPSFAGPSRGFTRGSNTPSGERADSFRPAAIFRKYLRRLLRVVVCPIQRGRAAFSRMIGSLDRTRRVEFRSGERSRRLFSTTNAADNDQRRFVRYDRFCLETAVSKSRLNRSVRAERERISERKS